MISFSRIQRVVIVPLLLLMKMTLAGCGGKSEPPPAPARPVTFVALTTEDPSATTRLAGTAESWKREELAFEVPGRVMRIVDTGFDNLPD